MKKILIAILGLSFILTLTSTVMAGDPKPQKNICLQLDPGPGALILGIKKGNKFVYGSLKFNMFTVQGLFYPLPVCGTGYVDGDNFVFYLSTAINAKNYAMMGIWDVVNETGAVNVNETTNGSLVSQQHTLILLDCGSL